MRKAVALTVFVVVLGRAHSYASFVNFESGHVRPLALSADRALLYAVNTPDNRVEIFRVTGEGLSRVGEVVVGLEPVAVGESDEDEDPVASVACVATVACPGPLQRSSEPRVERVHPALDP